MNQREREMPWDFFIAHAGADLPQASQLYDLLSPHSRVYLDKECLQYGDNWDHNLAVAQRAARVTLVLISANTSTAYYQREEIPAAIDMARRDDQAHRVVPIYLNDPGSLPDVPRRLTETKT